MSVYAIHILSDGQPIAAEYAITEVDIIREVNRIPYARFVLVDGDAAQQDFAISNEETLIPGKEIEIQLANEDELDKPISVFKGVIVKHSIEAGTRGAFLDIEAKDAFTKLTGERKSVVFREMPDQQIVQQIVEDNGLEMGEMAETAAEHLEMIQYYSTDWDFILSRAEANGLWVLIDQGVLSLIDPSALDTSSATHTIGFGLDEIYHLHLEANGEEQFETIESKSWDIQAQAMTSPAQAASFSTGQGNLDVNQIAGVTGSGSFMLQSDVALMNEELQAWADAKMRKSQLGFLRGYISLRGNANFKTLDVLELSGAGERFNGNTITTGVRHRINLNGWRTDLQLGLEKKWFSEHYALMDPPASGLLPGIRGLHIGLVESFEEDPLKHFRVKVNVPVLGDEAEPVWARFASPDAGNERGFFFRPEPGDEVVLGFFNGDPRQPVVLGSLYSENQVPPVEAGTINEDNFIKGIFSREGIQVWLDDENKDLHLLTSDNQEICLSEKDKKIELKDVNGNTVMMDENGITIKSAKNIILEAAENVEIKGAKVDIK